MRSLKLKRLEARPIPTTVANVSQTHDAAHGLADVKRLTNDESDWVRILGHRSLLYSVNAQVFYAFANGSADLVSWFLPLSRR